MASSCDDISGLFSLALLLIVVFVVGVACVPVPHVVFDVLLTPFASNSTESRDSQYVDYPRHTRSESTNSRGTPQTPHLSEDSRLIQTPPSPVNGDFGQRTIRSSPLNPTSPISTSYVRPGLPSSTASSSRPASRSSSIHPFVNSRPDAPLRINASPMGEGSRGSMILYRLADDPATARDTLLLPPKTPYAAGARDSLRGLVPYAYEPELDDGGPPDEEDYLHDPKEEGSFRGDKGHFPWRGVVNISVLIILILALLALFVAYPVFTYYKDAARNRLIDGNIRINATGQSPVLFGMPQLIDPDTPQSARTRTGFDGLDYELVFSDEFNVEGRTFYPGDDPFWEAVDLWYGATGDVEWYDPAQVITKDGALIITIDSVATTQSGLSRGSTAPFTVGENHNLEYRSGMVQTWNKFCFTNGYIEVSVTFPGPDENTAGYWPGAWTMGNLARPGYPASTDGMWPYTYDSCDVGTFPNQTLRDKSGPAGAIFSEKSRDRYNNELSWLTGQRTSACSCPDSDHPGPAHNVGRGAPEIDIFEASKDKQNAVGGTVSQSAQFAPFAHDYSYYNDSETKWKNFDPARTRANAFLGSAVQQSGSGAKFTTFGFEYHGHPKSRDDGYVMWQVNDSPTHRVGAGSVAADPLVDIGNRLIPEEPMAIILNLGMSHYPTKKYIDDHLQAYSDVNMTTWTWPMPRNELWEGGC
ncbi:concanavalin A-like lectin/glucanase [Coprinellus micaceus]|uniref:Concanavalin A-like lectin/glucanase n=1 Tax=Coprinellus micaceus TaxID=71717 RepID=A0A4Y7SW25_COPMI|nr:concanavalin A-like lectin/glucanase [Coprinellus micaceus]